MVGKRDIGFVIGIFTMTATWVGGGYLSGTVERIFSSGLVWVQAPVGYATSLMIAGFFFAGKFREKRFLTLMDPFQLMYGSVIAGLLTLPALMGEMLWSSAVLLVLASSLKIITGLDQFVSVVVSTATTVCYTLFGGIYAVAYTDTLQLIIITLGLVLAAPFAFFNQYRLPSTKHFLGVVRPGDAVQFADLYVTFIFGGIPWQALFQRILSSKSPRTARYVSIVSAFSCVALSIPVAVIGVAARDIDWARLGITFDGARPGLRVMNKADVLPLVIAYLTPDAVKFIGIGALVAATISSISSSFLAAGSLVTKSLYQGMLRPNAQKSEIRVIQVVGTLLVATVTAAVAMLSSSVYTLFGLCSDFIFILIFPQLVLLAYVRFTNSYGVLFGYFAALILRLSADTDIAHIFSDNHVYPNFPYKTASMLLNFLGTVFVSLLSRALIRKYKHFDVLKFYRDGKPHSFAQIRPFSTNE